MEIYVYQGDNRDLIGIVSLFSNFRAVWRYDEPGEFTMRVPLNGVKGLTAFEPGLWIWPQGAREIFIVESVVLSNLEGREEAEVTGRTASALLARRVIPDSTIGQGTHGQLMAGLLESIFSTQSRQFPGFSVNIDGTLGHYIEYQPKAGSCLDAIEELCQGAGLGFYTLFDPVSRGLTFTVYRANDLTEVGQGITVVFDPEYENIVDYEFTDSIEKMANVAYVVGAVDEDTGIAEKLIVSAPNFTTGEDYEVEFTGYGRFEMMTKYSAPHKPDNVAGVAFGGDPIYQRDIDQHMGYWYEPRNKWEFGEKS